MRRPSRGARTLADTGGATCWWTSYQDTNAGQYGAREACWFGSGGALTVVGDDDQVGVCVAWRAPENLHQLKDDYANLKVIKLEQNYRCTGRILKAANQLIANNPHLFGEALVSEHGFATR